MFDTDFQTETFDRSSPMSIFDYSRHLIGHSLYSLFGESVIGKKRKGKGRLGQMVEELFFNQEAVLSNNITTKAFWSIGDHRKFHVRPKARVKSDLAVNPNGGFCEKYCYWFNADYVKQIIDNASSK